MGRNRSENGMWDSGKLALAGLVALCVLLGLGYGLLVREGGNGAEGRVAPSNPGIPIEARVVDDGAQQPLASGELLSLNPLEDGWEIEFFNMQAGKQLARLADAIKDGPPPSHRLEPFLADGFSCGALVPDGLQPVFEDGPLSVLRPPIPLDAAETPLHFGAKGFAAALARIVESLLEAPKVRGNFKIIRVTPREGHVSTLQLVAFSGDNGQGVVEQNATWRIRWQWPSRDALPLLQSIVVEDFEQVTSSTDSGPLFTDCTKAVFANEPLIFKDQLSVGINSWVHRLEAYQGVFQFGHNGLAVGDVNGDGLDDIYRCQVGGLPNRLFIASADGTVQETAAEWGVDYLDNTRSALLIDLDNDADQDLVITLPGVILVLSNEGQVRFRERARIDVEHAFSLAAADFDEDGDLDVYACVYYSDRATASELPIPMPIHNATNGGANRLLRNDGGWSFTDVTDRVGLDADNSRFSYGAVWEDYDNDGRVDLFVANDFGRNNLYRNEGGHFRDVTVATGMADDTFGMSAAAGDYNRDGWVDFYKANMFSSAGNRVTHAAQFMPAAGENHRTTFRHLARGNTLFENRGGEFHDVSVERGVTMGRWSWGSIFVDYNNDGWEDLFVANGFVTGKKPDDL